MRLLFAGLCALLVACNAPDTQAPTDEVPKTSDTIAAIETAETVDTKTEPTEYPVNVGHSYTIMSKAYGGDDRNITVRLPAGYGSENNKSYPVVYLVDGGVDQDFIHIAGIHQSRDINWTFEPFILVGMETIDRSFELTPPLADVQTYQQVAGTYPGGAAQFRQFIREDLMPWVNNRYRTNGQSAVMGESLAGLFVIDTLMKAPDLFNDYVAVSPSLWWSNAEQTKNLKPVFEKFPEGNRRLYLTMADEAFLMREGLDQLIAQLKTSAPKGLNWAYFDRSNTEHHGSIYHGAALDAFRKLYPMVGRTGGSNPFLYRDGKMPELSDDAKASLEQECTLETARKVTFEEKNKNPAYWNGMCIRINLGPEATAGNWDF